MPVAAVVVVIHLEMLLSLKLVHDEVDYKYTLSLNTSKSQTAVTTKWNAAFQTT